ncbi:MAG: transcriptional repressor NrdR [Candidatus Jacksonbacteria bacterium]|nr:transcriptional repressor NrdR [Candidatus Jacksonbacteria bacterium]
MLCQLCNNDTRVLESRTNAQNTSIRRRRECITCKFRFSTVEEIEILDLTVIKRAGKEELYSREKLLEGIKRSLVKREYSSEMFKKLTNDIERDIQVSAKNNRISSSDIGEIVMKHLKNFDTVSYVRFASVYRDFKDPDDFAKEVKKLEN